MTSKRKFLMIKSIFLLAGAFTFAFLLGEFIHDSGHYLCHLAYGNYQVRVRFDPFGGTRIIGATGLPDRVLAVTSAAGPLPHLALALVSFSILWKRRRPGLLPLLLWAPVALIQEGVTFSLGLLTPGGDAAWIATLGVPPLMMLINGITFLVTGIGLVSILLPLAAIKSDDPFARKLTIVWAGMSSLMLIRFLHAFWQAPANIMENLVPLVLSLLLALIVVGLQRPLTDLVAKYDSERSTLIDWPVSAVAMILGAGMLVFQIIFPS